MSWIVTILATSLGLGALAAALLVQRHRWRWGHVSAGTVSVGDGPFRNARLENYRPRGVPFLVSNAAALSVAWGLLTGFIFAPAGLLFVVFAGDTSHGVALVGVLGVLAVSLFGFVLAVQLCRVSGALVTRDAARVWRIARTSIVHHLAVVGSFAVVVLGEGGTDGGLFLMAAIPCAVGLLHAGLLGAGAAEIARADAADVPPRAQDVAQAA